MNLSNLKIIPCRIAFRQTKFKCCFIDTSHLYINFAALYFQSLSPGSILLTILKLLAKNGEPKKEEKKNNQKKKKKKKIKEKIWKKKRKEKKKPKKKIAKAF